MQKKIHKILVPTDYSEGANVAANNALSLARSLDAQVIFLHAYHMPVTGSDDLMYISKIKETEEDKLEEEISKWGERYPGLILDYRVEYGSAADAIDAIVDRESIDLVVMGTKGQTNNFDAVFGSVASNTINNTKCAAIVIPSDVEKLELKDLIMASDFHKLEKYEFFYPLIHILDVTDAKVQIVNFQPELDLANVPAIEELKLDSMMDKYKHSHHYLEAEDIEEALIEMARSEAADMIVLTTKHYNLWQRIWHRSLTKQMVLHSTTPLMILHEDA